MRHARRSSHSLGRSPRRGTRRDGIPSHASAHDTVEDIFRVSFTGVKYNEMGYYYLFDGRWEAAPTADLYAAYPAADRRRPITVGKDGSDYEGTKFPTTIGAEDVHVIRFGEVVLTKLKHWPG